jgi:hypothetical protein
VTFVPVVDPNGRLHIESHAQPAEDLDARRRRLVAIHSGAAGDADWGWRMVEILETLPWRGWLTTVAKR